MGRKILKSLRRSQDKESSLDVKIEVDDGTVMEVNDGVVVVTSGEKGAENETVRVTDEAPEEPITVSVKAQPARQVRYVPAKIWTEEYDSDNSDDEYRGDCCWHLGSPRRRTRRPDETRDELHSFCGVFDCGGAAEKPILSGAHRSMNEKRPSSPETAVTSVLSDSFDDNESKAQERNDHEGVEQTLDSFWISAAKTKDVDLERKSKRKRIKKRLMRRRKGQKQRKGYELNEEAPEEESDDDQSYMSKESCSTTGDTTIISIKHVISDVESVENEDGQADARSAAQDKQGCPAEPSHEAAHDSPATDSSQESPPKDLQDIPPTKDVQKKRNPPSQPILKVPSVYESLSKDGSDEDSVGDAKKNKPRNEPKPSVTLLSQMLDVVETGVSLLALPEVPNPRKKKSKSTRRVRFAPDVQFSDADSDYDYSLDYSYSDPEFDEGESFDEEMYYTTEEDEEIDDEEAFFEDSPSSAQELAPSDSMSELEPAERTTSSYDDEIEPSLSTAGRPSRYEEVDDEEDEYISDGDDEGSVDLVGMVSSEARFEYLHEDSGDVSLEPSTEKPKSSQPSTTGLTGNEEDSAKESESGNSSTEFSSAGGDERGETRGDETPSSYKSFREMKSVRAASPSKSSMQSSEPLQSFHDKECQSRNEECAEKEASVTAVDERNDVEASMEPSESLHQLFSSDISARSSDHAEFDAMMIAVDERNGAQKADQYSETRTQMALVERYLDIPETCNHATSADMDDAIASLLCDDAISPIELNKSEEIVSCIQSSGRAEHVEKECFRGARETALQTTSITAGHVPLETEIESGTGDKNVEEHDCISDWLHSQETRQTQSSIAKKNELVREGWPSPPNPVGETEWGMVHMTDSKETSKDLFACDEFSTKNEAVVDHLLQSTSKRVTPDYRISDKKESLQLSLQGFARAKNKTKQWANFNNAPFQDLEVAPFDEM